MDRTNMVDDTADHLNFRGFLFSGNDANGVPIRPKRAYEEWGRNPDKLFDEIRHRAVMLRGAPGSRIAVFRRRVGIIMQSRSDFLYKFPGEEQPTKLQRREFKRVYPIPGKPGETRTVFSERRSVITETLEYDSNTHVLESLETGARRAIAQEMGLLELLRGDSLTVTGFTEDWTLGESSVYLDLLSVAGIRYCMWETDYLFDQDVVVFRDTDGEPETEDNWVDIYTRVVPSHQSPKILNQISDRDLEKLMASSPEFVYHVK